MPNDFRQGEHICVLYETEQQQILSAVEYLADGLRRGERCFYVAESVAALARFRSELATWGIDAAAMIESGALVEATHAHAHLMGGRFDCERMLAFLNEYVERTMKDGFSGLRTCGDMSWLLEDAPGSDQVVEYEAFLSGFFKGVPASGMCQYDQRKIGARLIHHALHTHSSIIRSGSNQPLVPSTMR